MFLTQRVLQFRREHADLFQSGNYLPLKASGNLADCCSSFARQLNDEWIVVIAPRLSSRIGFPPVGERWQDTVVDLPETFSLGNMRELFTNRPVRFDGRRLDIAEGLSVLPFAVIGDYKL